MKYIFNVILLGLVLMGCSKNPFAPVNSSEIGGFVQSTNFHDKKFGYRIHTKGEAKYYKSVTVVFPDGTQKEFENKSNTSPDGNTRWTILGDMFGLPILGEYKFFIKLADDREIVKTDIYNGEYLEIPEILTAKRGENNLAVVWKKVEDVDYYQVELFISEDVSAIAVSPRLENDKLIYVFRDINLTSGKSYHIHVSAWKKDDEGTLVASSTGGYYINW
ncbi:MAG: hypothetical protein AABY84_10530 [Candidatus Firestonebacteria bacterium]